MNHITYGVTEEVYELGNDRRTAYGIVAYANADEDGTATIVSGVYDITDDREELEKLVALCNDLELSVIHLKDVVEDFLAR